MRRGPFCRMSSQHDRDRGGARVRGYTPRWDKAAATFKARHPYCLGCAAIGKQVATEVVDHVEPHKGDQVKFWNTAQWQPSCRWHHDVIKPRLERMVEQGDLVVTDLWLNSNAAIAMSRRYPAQQDIGVDGWPVA